MKLLLCGGGTAGHITPAIAIAEYLTEHYSDSEILFVGRENGNENELITGAGFKYRTIKVQGIKRSLSIENIKRTLDAIKSINKAKDIIKEFNPDVILGTGGYVCWPVITAGRKIGIPTAIHESNVIPGLTTKLLSKKCNLVFLNYDITKNYLSQKTKTLTVGNPVRKDFTNITREEARKKLNISESDFFILSFGGSIGSQKMNDVILDVMKNYSSQSNDIKHIHAVGKRYFENIKSEKTEYKGCRILPFIDNIPLMMKAADIIISRSGAMTLSEITTVGVSSILIPSPNVTADHQYYNAKHLEQQGTALVIEEEKLSSKNLISAIKVIKNDKNGRKTRAKKMKQLSTPDSSKTIINSLFLIKKDSKRVAL